jgi:DNA polymerase eta
MNKSMLASKNLSQPITKASEGFHWVRVLAAELALRLTDARKDAPGVWPKSITLHVKQSYDAGRSKQAPFPFSRSITVDLIADAGNKLWKELVPQKDVQLKVTHVQLSFHGLEDQAKGQQHIESFLAGGKKRSREDDGSAAADGTEETNTTSAAKDSTSFVCPRCRKTISLSSTSTFEEEAEKEAALAVLRAEHDDFHFAQDLAREQRGNSRSPPPTKKKKKKKEEPKGIAKFFKVA